MCFDWLMVMSLESAGVGRFGSGEGGDCGNFCKRVTVPFGLRIKLSTLYGSMDELALTRKRRRCKESIVVAAMLSDTDMAIDLLWHNDLEYNATILICQNNY